MIYKFVVLLTWQSNRLSPYLIVALENRRRCAKPLDFQGLASATPMEEQRLFFILTLAGLIYILAMHSNPNY